MQPIIYTINIGYHFFQLRDVESLQSTEKQVLYLLLYKKYNS